jgi:hypothetical protein
MTSLRKKEREYTVLGEPAGPEVDMWQPDRRHEKQFKLNGVAADSGLSLHESFADLPKRCVGSVFQG